MKKLLFVLGASLLSSLSMAQSGSLPIEGNFGYINFNDNVKFKDSWYVGGASGFNFTDNAGIRAYYWRSLQDEPKLKKDELFDNLEIYGAETKVAIPISKYTKPYLVVGGGLLKPFGDYKGEDGTAINSDKFFGSAGGGLDLNFINFMSLTGYARAMVMDFDEFDNIAEDQSKIKASWNYGGSINFLIGRKGIRSKNKVNKDTDVVMPLDKLTKREQRELEREFETFETEEFEVREYNNRSNNDKQARINELRRQIEELEALLNKNDFSTVELEKELEVIETETTQLPVVEDNTKELELKYELLKERLEAQQRELERLKDQKNAEPQKVIIERQQQTPTQTVVTTPRTETKIIEKVIEKDIPDNDRDGILNDIDNCPNVAGTLENKGCPGTPKTQVITRPIETRIIERVPQRVEVERKMNFYAQSVFFETNSSVIKGSSLTNLNEIYNLMSQNPNANYIVEGHTDNVGDAAYNKQLSQKRAQAVVNYLSNRGISRASLSSIGIGEEQPIAENTTKSGREQNRRVVIRIR